MTGPTVAEAEDLIRAAAREEALDSDEAATREPRELIHAFTHGAGIALGADWTLTQALEYVATADLLAWVEHPLGGHDLEVRAGGRLVYFAVSRPGRVF